MARSDELRLMTRVARMYYEGDMRQSDIAKQLGLSQATISRLFKKAVAEGIVRISVNVPQGVYSELEEQLIAKYNLRDALGYRLLVRRRIFHSTRHWSGRSLLCGIYSQAKRGNRAFFVECHASGVG